MSTAITRAFEIWQAHQILNNLPARPDTVIFAHVPGLNNNDEIDRDEGIPDAALIVYQTPVAQYGVINDSAVAYSVVLDTRVGDFSFNWIGLVDSASNTLCMIVHTALQEKIASAGGVQGNNITRTFMMEFDGAAESSQITVTAETWQIDFSARLRGIDEITRLANFDYYGPAAFFNNGFSVVKDADKYIVSAGLAYIGGVRALLTEDKQLSADEGNIIYADVSLQGSVLGEYQSIIRIGTEPDSGNLIDYRDQNGFMHYVAILSRITQQEIEDTRTTSPIEQIVEKINASLQTVNNLSEIKDAGPAAIAETLKNLGLDEVISDVQQDIDNRLITLDGDVNLNVGPAGDFKTLNLALLYISKRKSLYVNNGLQARLTLLPAFELSEQINISAVDLSFVEIYASTTIKINRPALSGVINGHHPAFAVTNGGKSPLINAKFDMHHSDTPSDTSVAFMAHGAGSSLNFAAGAGAINCFGFGLLALSGASFSADSTVWNNCAADGVSVKGGSSGSANDSYADGCYNGFLAEGSILAAKRSFSRHTRSAGFVARMSGSLDAEFADAQNGAAYGFYAAVSSMLNVTRGNCSGCRFGISGQRSSKIAAEEVIADNCTETNISARRYTEIEAQSCHAVNTTTTPLYCIRANYSGSVIVESGTIGGACTTNICRATTNSEIQATDAIIAGAIGTSIAVYIDESSNFNGRRMNLNHSASTGTAVQVLRASTADLSDSIIVGGGNYGVVAQYNGVVAADNAQIHGSVNYSVYATDGGKLSVTNAAVRRDPALDQITDIVISRGGTISAFGAVGGKWVAINAVSASGIIFQ